jgi:hypothetical protein
MPTENHHSFATIPAFNDAGQVPLEQPRLPRGAGAVDLPTNNVMAVVAKFPPSKPATDAMDS